MNLIYILCLYITSYIYSAPRGDILNLETAVIPNITINSINIIANATTENIIVNSSAEINNLTVNNDTTLNNISVQGDTDLNGLTVTGGATLCDDVYICQNLTVGNSITVPNLYTNISFTDLTASGNGTIDGTLSIGDNATFNQNITVQGTGNFASLLTSGNTTVNGDLTVNGTFSLPGSFSPTNIDLVDSTNSSGNINKNGIRFIHNFGTNNTFVGKQSGSFLLTSGAGNSGFGSNSLQATTTTAQNNTALGANTLINLLTGSSNIAIGSNSGSAYTTESSNILINNPGNIGDNNIIKIGIQGNGLNQQNKCFIAGIYGNTIGAASTVLINSNNQLGTIVSSRKFKENITPLTEALMSAYSSIQAVQFNYKNDHHTQYGFIAEEVAKIIPELGIYDEKGEPISIQYHLLYPLLHQLIIMNKQKIDLLEKKILLLQNQLNTMLSSL